MKHYLATIFTLFLLLYTLSADAKPAEQTVQALNHSVLRVLVDLPDGKKGFGSAVVVASDQVITNCHVVANAKNIHLIVNGQTHAAVAIKADWKHDLCMLTVNDLAVPAVRMGKSISLQYETPVFTVGYPDGTTIPVNTFGAVKGLFPMDDSVIIRASSAFKPGASGGGAFDDAGNLVGIITLKSRGDSAHYYYMPVEWVQALMEKPAQALGGKSEKPFWADTVSRPYFMQVVSPYVSQQWKALMKVATEWVSVEPDTAESWFYLATAEFAIKDYAHAETHFRKVLALNDQHSQALVYLEKISAISAKTTPLASALTDKVALID
jgi:serine protease Do